jgi:hypothetical protein
LVTVAATFGSIGYAQDLAKDRAYCRKLVDAYTLGGMDRGGSLPQSVDLSVAIDQCRSDNPEPAIPVLLKRLRDAGFDVPARS